MAPLRKLLGVKPQAAVFVVRFALEATGARIAQKVATVDFLHQLGLGHVLKRFGDGSEMAQ